jgi:uncharacterized protein
VPLLRREADPETLDLFEEAGRNVERASTLLRDLLVDYPEHAHLARDLVDCEHEGDRLTHDIIHRLRTSDARQPVDIPDGHALASALDDVVDFAEQTADMLGLYAVEAPMEQADQMARVLVEAAQHVAAAVCTLRTGADASAHFVEVNRLENEADRLQRDAVASLFANGIDPMVVIRWKDIFASLEGAVDACEKVAHVLEGIALKRGR